MAEIPQTMLALCITFPILSIIAVVCRYWARHAQSARLGADDWIILFALVCCIATGILGLVGAKYGDLGVHEQIGPDGFPIVTGPIVTEGKVTYASQIVGIGALCSSKLSLLFFYRRIFSIDKFRLPFYVMLGINAFWGFAYFLVYLLRCVPISDAWSIVSGEPRHCIPNDYAEYSYAITNVLLDAAVLAMPMPMVWRLQLTLTKKIAVSSIFLLGIIVTGIGIAKTIAFYNFGALYASNHDGTYDAAVLFYYTVPENCLAVVGACLPTLRPIFHGFSPESVLGSIRSAVSLRSYFSGSRGTSHSKEPDYSAKDHVSKNTVGNFSKLSEEDSELPSTASTKREGYETMMEDGKFPQGYPLSNIGKRVA
ncbi:hypothetical protein MMC10_007514 [Thelotrema lepadinum]|nr:hypothetical protein [Thelotrema lepadinum]